MTQSTVFTLRNNWLLPVLLAAAAAAAGCGEKNPVLGTTVTNPLAPVVSSWMPADNLTGVAVFKPVISVDFNQPMQPLKPSDFQVTCTTPCVNPAGTVALNEAGTKATFTPTANLAAQTVYNLRVADVKSLSKGVALDRPYVSRFTTGAAPAALQVSSVNPVANKTGVAVNQTAVSANFSEAVMPMTDPISFTLTCATPCVNPSTTLSLDSTGKTGSLALGASTPLAPSTVYTAKVANARSLATGAALAAPVTWQFTTGATPDKTRPMVMFSTPATMTPPVAVAVNSAVSVGFSEAMAANTVSPTNFTLTCAAPCVNPMGNVNYDTASHTASWVPTAPLMVGTTYTAKITSATTDLAGNNLGGNQAGLPAASDYIWTFTTVAATAASNITVKTTSPVANAMTVCPTSAVVSTFNRATGLRMDPASINGATVMLNETATPFAAVAVSSIALDSATGQTVTFVPQKDLTVGTSYTARIKGGANGVKDLAIPANTMVDDMVWTFIAASCVATPSAAVPLGTATTFGAFGGSAGTTNMGINTVINGDVGTTAASTAVTGFHDAGPGCTYTETTLNMGAVNGNIFTSAPPPTVACPSEGTATTASIAAAARADALTAYNALVAKPAGADPGAGNLANLVLAPGVYTAVGGSFMVEGGNLTLDAQGNANAVWIFQMATTLTVGGPGAAAPQSVILVNGAQAKNVYWQVGSAATINAGGGGTMVGTIISQAGASFSTMGNAAVTTLNGRVLSLNAAVTMVNTVINVPAP